MSKSMAVGMFLGILAFALLLWMGGGGRGDGSVPYKRISAAEAKAFMDSGEPYVLLDVRTAQEFQERHIRGAILIPYTEIKKRAPSRLPDKDALILVYCRSGRRSAIAAKDLAKLGYTRVYDFGGINDWPYEIITGSGSAKQ